MFTPHHPTQHVYDQAVLAQGSEVKLLAHLQGLHALLDQQLLEIEVVAKTFDYSKFAGFTGMLSGCPLRAAH